MQTTLMIRTAALLRAVAAWAVRLADRFDPPAPPAVEPSSAGGPGPRPKRWWWPW